MRRREFVRLTAGAAMAWPLAARAQQKPMPVIGFLNSGSPNPAGLASPYMAAFGQGLKETGFVDGQNVAIEYRWAEGHYARLPALATDLVGRRVDLIAASGGDRSALAAKSATSTIPIVSVIGGDPVAEGLVSLTTAGASTSSARSTNTIEGFWSIFKRGVVGTFHRVSAKYLPLYVAEFQFRYNNRENADIFGTAISGC